MSNKPQARAPYNSRYLAALESAVKLLGRNKAARATDRDPTTIHRNINDGNLTYVMAIKLIGAINAAGLTDDNGQPIEMPPPFVPVVDMPHYRFCQLYERFRRFPKIFDEVMKESLVKLHEAETDDMLGSANDAIRNPK